MQLHFMIHHRYDTVITAAITLFQSAFSHSKQLMVDMMNQVNDPTNRTTKTVPEYGVWFCLGWNWSRYTIAVDLYFSKTCNIMHTIWCFTHKLQICADSNHVSVIFLRSVSHFVLLCKDSFCQFQSQSKLSAQLAQISTLRLLKHLQCACCVSESVYLVQRLLWCFQIPYPSGDGIQAFEHLMHDNSIFLA